MAASSVPELPLGGQLLLIRNICFRLTMSEKQTFIMLSHGSLWVLHDGCEHYLTLP